MEEYAQALVGRVRARFRRAGRSGSLISPSRCQPMFERPPIVALVRPDRRPAIAKRGGMPVSFAPAGGDQIGQAGCHPAW